MTPILQLAVLLAWLGAALDADAAKVSVLVDLDPNSAEQTVIVETVTADQQGRLYVCDRVSGNVHRNSRDRRQESRADSSGLVFNQQGHLFLTRIAP